MKICVEGGLCFNFGDNDKDIEIIRVETQYMMSNKRGAMHKLIPTKIRDIKRGDRLAVKIDKKKIISKRKDYFFAGQDAYRIKTVDDFVDEFLEQVLDVTTDRKYICIDRFLFKGVRADEHIPVKSRVHRDRKQKRRKRHREISDVSDTNVRRERRSNKTIQKTRKRVVRST